MASSSRSSRMADDVDFNLQLSHVKHLIGQMRRKDLVDLLEIHFHANPHRYINSTRPELLQIAGKKIVATGGIDQQLQFVIDGIFKRREEERLSRTNSQKKKEFQSMSLVRSLKPSSTASSSFASASNSIVKSEHGPGLTYSFLDHHRSLSTIDDSDLCDDEHVDDMMDDLPSLSPLRFSPPPTFHNGSNSNTSCAAYAGMPPPQIFEWLTDLMPVKVESNSIDEAIVVPSSPSNSNSATTMSIAPELVGGHDE